MVSVVILAMISRVSATPKEQWLKWSMEREGPGKRLSAHLVLIKRSLGPASIKERSDERY